MTTLATTQGEYSSAVMSAVDSQHGVSHSGESLTSTVQAELESSLRTTIEFAEIDKSIVNNYLKNELTGLSLSEKEYVESELNATLAGQLNGAKLENVYLQKSLITLAQQHYLAKKTAGAKALYELALLYSSSEPEAFSILSHLAKISEKSITNNSSATEILACLAESTGYYERFLNLYPNSNSKLVEGAYRNIAYSYFCYFPKLLTYENYSLEAYQIAKNSLEIGLNRFPNSNGLLLLSQRILAWEHELISLQSLVDAVPEGVTLTLTNTSATSGKITVFPKLPYSDSQNISFDGAATLSRYKGHNYILTITIPVEGGESFSTSISLDESIADSTITWSPTGVEVAPSDNNETILNMDFGSVDYPYNLNYQRNIDVFNLFWFYVGNLTVDHFKVYRNGVEVGTTTSNAIDNLPLIHADNNYNYTVVAFDSSGNSSPVSPTLEITPGDLSAYSEFFDWLTAYFGDTNMLSIDDPDQDGLSNYQEFLANSDPTKAAGPNLLRGPRGFSTATMNWHGVEGITYQIMCNDTSENIVSVTGDSYTYRDLMPDTEYTFKIRIGETSDWSTPLTIKTLANNSYFQENSLTNKIDTILPAENITASNLIALLKSAIPEGETAFANIPQEQLEEFLNNELLKLENLNLTDEQWHSDEFEEIYIYNSLTKLAEVYFRVFLDDKTQQEYYQAAQSLYHVALNFQSNNPIVVSNTLNRIAEMELQASPITVDTLNQQMSVRLDFIAKFGDTYKENPLLNPYKSILSAYLNEFPNLLSYNNYNQDLRVTVDNLIDDWIEFSPSLTGQEYKDRVADWSLNSLMVDVAMPEGGVGKLLIRNISDKLTLSPFLYRNQAEADVREFLLDSTTQVVPVYSGHLYELELTTPVLGGNDWVRKIPAIRFESGKTITYSNNQWQSVDGENMLNVVANQPTTPYNLTANIYGDVFDLTWNFVTPDGFDVDYYNVYRGTQLIDSVDITTKFAIPRDMSADQVYSYTVSAVSTDGVETVLSEPFQVLPEFTKDDLTYFEWKQNYFGNQSVLATDDSDGDGLTNYQEFLLGSNPLLAPPQSSDDLELDKLSGIQSSYYIGSWLGIPNFSSLMPFKSDILNRFQFNSTIGNILDSGVADGVAVELKGYFEVPADGKYKFFLSSDDSSKLYIDDVVRINHDELNSQREILTELHLTAGIHTYKIEYFEYNSYAHLQLYWSGDSFERTRFDQSGLWYLEGESSDNFKEYLASQRDSDGDGLSDFFEIKIGTNRLDADSDNDGIDDATEVNTLYTDPLNADSNNNGINDGDELKLTDGQTVTDLSMLTFTPTILLTGDSFSSYTGLWRSVETSAQANVRRGKINYQFELAQSGIYRLNTQLKNIFETAEVANIDIYIDGELIAPAKVEISSSSVIHSEFTPFLPAGSHSISLDWDNYSSTQMLQIDGISLDRLTSLSNKEKSQKTLEKTILEKRNTISKNSSSRTSPAFIEGTAMYPQLVQVDNATATQLSGNKWYGEVQLTPDRATNVMVDFENSGLSSTEKINWETTNIITENGANIKIRKGDSLLLSASPENGKNSSECVIVYNNQEYTHKGKDDSVVIKFDSVGSFEITGSYTPKNDKKLDETSEYGSITVEVVDFSFGRDEVICWNNYAREWGTPLAEDGIEIVFDNRLKDASLTPLNTENLARVYIDDNKPRFVTARLADGPLLARQQLTGVDCNANGATYVKVIETYEDGSELVETLIVMSSPQESMTTELDIFVPGVLFETGEISLVISADEFDELGMKKVRFIRSAGVSTSICHTLRLYQSGEYIGLRLQ